MSGQDETNKKSKRGEIKSFVFSLIVRFLFTHSFWRFSVSFECYRGFIFAFYFFPLMSDVGSVAWSHNGLYCYCVHQNMKVKINHKFGQKRCESDVVFVIWRLISAVCPPSNNPNTGNRHTHTHHIKWEKNYKSICRFIPSSRQSVRAFVSFIKISWITSQRMYLHRYARVSLSQKQSNSNTNF